MTTGWGLKYNPLVDTYELRLELVARISPPVNYNDPEPPQACFSNPERITVSIPRHWFNQNDPDALLFQINKAINTIWTQAIAGMAGKYTELIQDAIAPSIQEILEHPIGKVL